MNQKILSLFFFTFTLYAENNSQSYLILNEFDSSTLKINQALVKNFDYLDIQFDDITIDNFEGDSLSDFISFNMDKIKELGLIYDINYVLSNKVFQIDGRISLESRLYHTRSGGLINQRKTDLINYFDGELNELNLWIGELTGGVKTEWRDDRNSILFLNANDIVYKKTPIKSAMRSFLIPGWGQLYSNEKLYALLWVGTELSLGMLSYFSFLNYQDSRNNYLSNQKLYTNSEDEKDVANYRLSAEKDWNNHKMYSELTILFTKVIGVGWLTNTLHAWIVGPRPRTKINRKWDKNIINPR